MFEGIFILGIDQRNCIKYNKRIEPVLLMCYKYFMETTLPLQQWIRACLRRQIYRRYDHSLI